MKKNPNQPDKEKKNLLKRGAEAMLALVLAATISGGASGCGGEAAGATSGGNTPVATEPGGTDPSIGPEDSVDNPGVVNEDSSDEIPQGDSSPDNLPPVASGEFDYNRIPEPVNYNPSHPNVEYVGPQAIERARDLLQLGDSGHSGATEILEIQLFGENEPNGYAILYKQAGTDKNFFDTRSF
ncbi:hypothetical protein FWC31_03010 [Candidatus Saccharibacteria bacterium]|nr:hypothetical protein [Candidatus Saccharibacteria bacterium]